MIVLGKNYKAGNQIVVYPIAIIKDNKIELIENQNRNELLPNSGRVYTPPFLQNITPGNFMLYKLEPSNTYYEEDSNSHYYSVNQTMKSNKLLEVFHLDESFEEDTNKIINKIRFGFFSKIELLNQIILRTSDNYLLGPFKTDYNTEDNKVKLIDDFEVDKFILPVFDNSRNQLEFETYYDPFDEIQRSFTLTYPEQKNVINELDIAPDDYIVWEAIRFLRGQEEFSDITRRVSQRIKEWIRNTNFSEEYNIKRLKRTLELLREITPDHDENIYQKYANELISLPSIQNIIEIQIEKKFELEIEGYLKENRDIINKNKQLKAECSIINSEIIENKKNLKKLQQNIDQYSNFMSSKKENMEEEILEHYFQQLMINNLSNNKSKQLPFVFNKESFVSSETHGNLEDLKKVFKYNLGQYEERDMQNLIFDYCLLALKYNQPLIIVGKSSFKLANLIQKTFAGTKNQNIIPDSSHFSLNVLNDIKNEKGSPLNFTIIQNIYVSPASLNLIGFINAYESIETNNKMIFTFDSFDEGRFLLEQLESYLILNVNSRTFLPSPYNCNKTLKYGQTNYEMMSNYVQPSISFEESLEEILEEIFESSSIENEEEIRNLLKNKFKRLIFTNQYLKATKNSLSYFPFLEKCLKENQDE